MPKLSDKSELSTVADVDLLYVVDVSDTSESAAGSSKKVQAKNLPFAKLDDEDIVLSSVAPSASLLTATINPTAGNLNGTYAYSVNYYTSSGETATTAWTANISPVNQQVDLSNIPISSDPKVIGRRIYRNQAGADTLYKKLAIQIADNTTTSITDNVADGSLGENIQTINTTGGAIYNGSVRIGVTGPSTTAFGYNAHPQNYGYANTAFGTNCLYSNTVGLRNVGVGMFALFSNTTGNRNTAVGVHSLNYNITGSDNCATGYAALIKSTANGNSAFGSYSLGETVAGEYNTSFGYLGMQLNTSGSNNAAFGKSSLTKNTTGSNNTAIGMNSLANCQTGIGNVALGANSGYHETGSNKLFIDNASRLNEADARLKALIYGGFDASTDNQFLTFNAAITWRPKATVTPANNGELTFELTSNTSLTIKVKGSDGTVRSAVLTLS